MMKTGKKNRTCLRLLIGGLALACLLTAGAGLLLFKGGRLHLRSGQTYSDLVYKTYEGGDLKLDLYLPKGSRQDTPVLVFIHGGGWTSGEKGDLYGLHGIAPELLQAGVAVASIDYRLSDGQSRSFPGNIADCKDAIRWLRAHAADYHLDPQQIGVLGGSAGGHLALMVAFTSEADFPGDPALAGTSAAVAYVVNFYGPTDMPALLHLELGQPYALYCQPENYHALLCGAALAQGMDADLTDEQVEELALLYSPTHYLHAGQPPCLTVQGTDDTIVPDTQAQLLDEGLEALGIPHQTLLLPAAGHGFAGAGEAALAEMRQTTLDFVLENLK